MEYSRITNESKPNISNTNLYPKSPNSPLLTLPFIKIKLSCKNLDKIEKAQSLQINNTNNFKMSLNPLIKISNNKAKDFAETEVIHHNSPNWVKDFIFNVENYKTDRIILEVYHSHSKHSNDYLGFQVIPIKYIEKNCNSSKYDKLCLKIIESQFDSFFVDEPNYTLSIENHDIDSYKEDEESSMLLLFNNNFLGLSPLIIISYEYVNFVNLWRINVIIHSIIERKVPITNLSIYYYKLFCKRNDGLYWYKEVSFDQISQFRNYVIIKIPEVIFSLY